MPVEREISKILAMPDDDLFRWRADARKEGAGDVELSALLEASLQEVVYRAGRAWSSISEIRGRT